VNVACQIITNANICYYAGTELVVKKNDDGSLKSISVNPETGAHFSDIFWVSKGIDGELLGASEDNLSKLFADSPELIAKMKEK
jgi:hypothetical protein